MAETQFTPGPWLRIDTADYAEIHAQFRPSSQPVALVGKPDDANLISAAPDLLAALIAAESLFNHTFAMGGTIHKQMRAAIAKALAK